MWCLCSDGDIEYTVAREMDPEMQDDFERFIAENEAQWLLSSSWLTVTVITARMTEKALI